MNELFAKETSIADDSAARLDELAGLAEQVVAECRRRGAGEAEVGISDDQGLNAQVRLGEVETIEYTRDRGLSLTVYFGKRKGSASTADLHPDSIRTTIEQACAIARHTEEDPCSGLADAALMATRFPDFDLWHPRAMDADAAVALAIEAETAGRDFDSRISNSDGASVSQGGSLSIYANSHGFVGRERSTSYSVSASLIAGEGDGMQRDYWYDAHCHPGLIASADAIGRKAAQRTLARMNPRPVQTGTYPVLFAAEVARSLIGSLVSAVSGGALYRKASFLLDSLGQQVLPRGIDIIERPHILRGHRSAAFDGEGVATREASLVEDGVLQRYVLGSYAARKLGMTSTGNAGGMHNTWVRCGTLSQAQLISRMQRGLLITELMGQGTNLLTGDYSRGAAGFWIEDGAIAYPVDEVTIAGNMRAMLMAIEEIGADIDPRSSVEVGSVLIGGLTVAGAE